MGLVNLSLYVDKSVTLRNGDVLLIRGDHFHADGAAELYRELEKRGLGDCLVIFQGGEKDAVDITRLDTEEMKRLGWVRVETVKERA